jgi:hypothetical protein
MFVEEFCTTFEDSNKECPLTNKLRAFRKKPRPTIVYESGLKQLACDISWDETTFMN